MDELELRVAARLEADPAILLAAFHSIFNLLGVIGLLGEDVLEPDDQPLVAELLRLPDALGVAREVGHRGLHLRLHLADLVLRPSIRHGNRLRVLGGRDLVLLGSLHKMKSRHHVAHVC